MNYTAQTAQNLAGYGRNGDSMLVHMQPREVAGLQALAMQHGGSLTINPETGLPEAGFLGDLLGFVAPIALGAWLGPAGAGFGGGFFKSALTAGLAVGAGTWAITGDPLKGLSAGLGAGSGFGLGSNIANYGAAVKSVPSVAETLKVGAGALDDVTAAALNAGDDLAMAGAKSAVPGSQAFWEAGKQIQSQIPMVGASTAAPATDLVTKMGLTPKAGFTMSPTQTVPNFQAGVSKMFSSPENFVDYFKQNKGDILTAGMPFLAAASQPPETNFPVQEEPIYGGPYLPTDRGVRFPTEEERRRMGSREFSYFENTNPYPGFYPSNPMPMMASGGTVANGGMATYEPAPTPDDPGSAVQLSREGYGMSAFDPQNPRPASNVQVVNQVPGIVDQLSEVGYAQGGVPEVASVPSLGAAGVGAQYDIPAGQYQSALAAREEEIKKLMGRGRNNLAGIGALGGQMGMPQSPIQNSPFAQILMGAKPLTREQAEAMVPAVQAINPSLLPEFARTYLPEQSLAGSLDITGVERQQFDRVNPRPPEKAGGGMVNMEDGGFVVPADVGSHLGNGSSGAGLGVLARKLGARPIRGRGDGMSDDIPARIGTAQRARVANEEAYVPRAQVARIGGGSVKKGAQKLYAMMDKVRKDRTGTTKQGREINPEKYVPA